MPIPEFSTPFVDPSLVDQSGGGGLSNIMTSMPDSGGGGKPDWKKILAAVGTGLGLGLVGSKLSGGNISFGEALGHVGKGFADTQYKKMEDQRQLANEQHGRQLKMVHDFFSSNALEGVDVSKYPKIAELRQKYSDKLMNSEKGPAGEPLSPKETTELLGLIATAQDELGKANTEREQSKIIETENAKNEAEIQRRSSLYSGMFMNQPPSAMGGMTPTQGGADMMGRNAAISGMRAEMEQNLPVEVTDDKVKALLGGEKGKPFYATRGQIAAMNAHLLTENASLERTKALLAFHSKQAEMSFEREWTRQESATKRGIFMNLVTNEMRNNAIPGQPHVSEEQAVANAIKTMQRLESLGVMQPLPSPGGMGGGPQRQAGNPLGLTPPQ